MGPVWLSLCAGLRLRWRVLAALAVLLGVIGGVVLTAAAGARRIDTAYPRLLHWANAAQVAAGGIGGYGGLVQRDAPGAARSADDVGAGLGQPRPRGGYLHRQGQD